MDKARHWLDYDSVAFAVLVGEWVRLSCWH
jgi:hypothetical protein